MKKTKLLNAFEIFFNIIKKLRNPGGCPWDIAQTPMTMRHFLLEEAYEAVDAIEEYSSCKKYNNAHIKEELGDILLNTLMIAYMYEQEGAFSAADVFEDVTKKLIRRHPHVFGKTEGYEGPESGKKTSTPEAVFAQWENIKEKVENKETNSILDGIPKSFPPILRAQKILKRVTKNGFEWNCFEEVKEKINEELREFFEAVSSGNHEQMEDELGDVLFIMINAARFLKINPEQAISNANKKMERRFRFIEKKMQSLNLKLCKETQNIMEEFWQEAKKNEKP